MGKEPVKGGPKTGPKEVDPKVKRDLGPGHVTRPDPGPKPGRNEADEKEEN